MHQILVLVILSACTAHRQRTEDTVSACALFDARVEAFQQTLIRPSDGPPQSDPASSPAAAARLLDAAEACLGSRGVAFERIGDGLRFKSEAQAGQVVAAVVKALNPQSGVRAEYSTAFLLERPYAAASFDKVTRVLFVPHDSIRAEVLSPAVRHELKHVASLSLLEQGARLRHLVLENAQTKPDALSLDEVFAYTAIAIDPSVDSPSRERSRRNAESYLQFIESALAAPDTVWWVETHDRSQAKPLDSALKKRLIDFVVCVKAEGAEACDRTLASTP